MLSHRIAFASDNEVSNLAMLRALQQSLPQEVPARRCRMPLPTHLFYAATAPPLL